MMLSNQWVVHMRWVMLDELDELREAIKSGDYSQALALIDELDEMSRDDKINKIGSYMRVLLIHLIKQYNVPRNLDIELR
ncbi:hypothetical protein [Candidatus Entotheonella palauensis]|uniref:hypothetical protein n=1 Tax=Candidatus Entotheonella palauensis TaxID=93172 RepID=UPI0015C48389|nr:hypothetical protein [Candidatus Entotheonella palauensis]